MTTGLLESAQSLLAGLLELGRTRFELFGTELREELARLASTLLGGLAVLMLVALGLGFGALAVIFSVSEANRLAATLSVTVFFFLAAGLVAWQVRRLAESKPRPFDDTLAELRRDLQAIKR